MQYLPRPSIKATNRPDRSRLDHGLAFGRIGALYKDVSTISRACTDEPMSGGHSWLNYSTECPPLRGLTRYMHELTPRGYLFKWDSQSPATVKSTPSG